jgi:hypothetical protein
MPNIDTVKTKCPECGLRVNVTPTQQDIAGPLSRCKHEQGWGHCLHLRAVISAAYQSLRSPARVFVCKVCGLEARKATVAHEPTVLFWHDDMRDLCVERSLAPEPFKCPNLHSAAMEAGVIGTDGDWIRAEAV